MFSSHRYRQLFNSCLQIALTAYEQGSYKFTPAQFVVGHVFARFDALRFLSAEALVGLQIAQVKIRRRCMLKEVTTMLTVSARPRRVMHSQAGRVLGQTKS